MSPKSKNEISKKLSHIGKLIDLEKSDDYESLRKRLGDARGLFHDLLAERFTETFNAHLASLPHETLEQKQALVRQANADLRMLGLAVKCPKTQEAAMLHANNGYDPEKGRFQIRLIAKEAGGKRTHNSSTLFPVNLIAHPVRRESLAEYWADRVANTKPAGRRK